jgi:hypothetical protein
MVRTRNFLIAVFDAPTRGVVATLWFFGATLAALAALLSFMRPGFSPYWIFLILSVLLLLIAYSLLTSRMWAFAVSFVLLVGQVVGVVGTTLELVYGIDSNKATELRALGFDARFGVWINLAFSVASVAVLAIALIRAKRAVV